MRIGIEPPGKRQAELDESAKRPDGPLRSNHDLPSPVGSEDGATGSSQRTAIGSCEGPYDVRQPAYVGEETC